MLNWPSPMPWRISICWSKWFLNGIIDPKWTLFNNWHRVVLALRPNFAHHVGWCFTVWYARVSPCRCIWDGRQEQKRGWRMKLQGWGRMMENVLFTCIPKCCCSVWRPMQSLRVVLELFLWIQAKEFLFNKKKVHLLTKKNGKRHGMPFIFYLSSRKPTESAQIWQIFIVDTAGAPQFPAIPQFWRHNAPHFGMPSFGLSVTFVWCAVTWLTRTVLMLVALASAFSPAGGFFRQSPTFPTDLPTKVIDFCPVNRTFFWQRALVTHNDGSNEKWPLCGGNDPQGPLRGDPFFTEEWIENAGVVLSHLNMVLVKGMYHLPIFWRKCL